ncbi:MAG: hypothetical protein ACR2HH_01520 [Chthoniobacterales bacterium]
MKNKLATYLAVMLCVLTEVCSGENALFIKESRNYGRQGPRGHKFRREFEARMFNPANWRQRLYVTFYEPDVDQTLEVYSKPNGALWLSYTRATPSLSKAIDAERWGYDTEKELNAVRIMRREIALPDNVAKEIELLWQTMLPGSLRGGEDQSERIYVHPPGFEAFLRRNNSVRAGTIPMAAIDTPAYRSFVHIVEDLLKACNGGSKDQIFARLPSRMQHLRALLKRD